MRKQGSADRDVMRPKTEPVAHAMSVKRVEQIGLSTNYPKDNPHLGRGFTAPHDAGRTVHSKGSQGKR